MLTRCAVLLAGLGLSTLTFTAPSHAAEETWQETSCKDYLASKSIRLPANAQPRKVISESYAVEALDAGVLKRVTMTYRVEDNSAVCTLTSLAGQSLSDNGYKRLEFQPSSVDNGQLDSTGDKFVLYGSTTYAFQNAPLQALLGGNEEVISIEGSLSRYSSTLDAEQAQSVGRPEWAGEEYVHTIGQSDFSFQLTGIGPLRTVRATPEEREVAKAAFMDSRASIVEKFKKRVAKARSVAVKRDWSKRELKTKVRALKAQKNKKLSRAKDVYREAVAPRQERTPWTETIMSE